MFDLEDALRKQDTDVPEFIEQNELEVQELFETGSAEFLLLVKSTYSHWKSKGV